MYFDKPAAEIIKARTSVRTYRKQPLTPEIKERIHAYLQGLEGPFQVNTRIELIDSETALSQSNAKLGTYGVIRGASSFLAAAVEKADKSLEELGYVLEKAILFATSLGLGTCWLGGTFSKSEFSRALKLAEHEYMPAVTPIGYPADSRSFVDAFMRFAAGSKNRKSWEELFYEENFGESLKQAKAGKYSVPLEMVRLAPSASNKQPWRIVRSGKDFHFYLQHTKGYAKMLAFDIQRLDMGIAMCHFEHAAVEEGIKGEWRVMKVDTGNLPEGMEYIVTWTGE